jgi:hypothetical protein
VTYPKVIYPGIQTEEIKTEINGRKKECEITRV